MSDVIVRLVVNKKNGTYKSEILRHEGEASCGDGIDEQILEDLLNAEVPGYGKLATEEDSGYTCEHFEQKQAKQAPHQYKYEDDDEEEEKTKKQDQSLGYGV